jgi:uncharacterized membrane protein
MSVRNARMVAGAYLAIALVAGRARAVPRFQGLGDLPGGVMSSTALAVSLDGSVVVGQSSSAQYVEAFRWTAADGMRGLGILPGWVSSSASGVADDGSIVVGTVFRGDPRTSPEFSPFIWDETNGMRYLQDVLEEEYGLDLTGWTPRSVHISGDGRTLVGGGLNPEGRGEAWIAVVPEPGVAGVLVVGAVGLLRRRVRR